MLQNTIDQMDQIDAEVGDKYKLIDVDQDGRVSDEEIVQAMQTARPDLTDEDVKQFIEAVPHCKDGKVKLSEVLELADAAESEDDSEVLDSVGEEAGVDGEAEAGADTTDADATRRSPRGTKASKKQAQAPAE